MTGKLWPKRSSTEGLGNDGARDPVATAVLDEGRRRKVRKAGSQLRERAGDLAQKPAAKAVLAVGAAWAVARLTIEALHYTRRSFLRQLLFDLSEALEGLGQEHWLDFGCLLGVHRDGDLIPHDNDIDMAVLNPDWPALLEGLRARLPKKYSLKVVRPATQPESSWIRVYCPLGMADLFGAYDDGGGKVFVDCGHGDTMHIDKALVLPTSHKTFKGHQISVPADLEGTLAKRYGPTWRVPAYQDKGADTVEGNKMHSKIFRLLARIGIRI